MPTQDPLTWEFQGRGPATTFQVKQMQFELEKGCTPGHKEKHCARLLARVPRGGVLRGELTSPHPTQAQGTNTEDAE